MPVQAIYRAMLWCYPAAFRQEYGEEMAHAFALQIGEARREGGWGAVAGIWLRAAADLIIVAPKEHRHVISQDVRYALRNLALAPGFAAVAILSLALGIGANTAVFSLLNGVMMSALPVPEPEQLVMLSDPRSAGVAIGMMSGDRRLYSYAEYEQLRGQATDVFSSLAASQSALERWQLRIGSREAEEARGRLVSGAYFEVLGIRPLLGRLLTRGDDALGAAPYVVISHDYWVRRFGGNLDALGKTVTIRKAPLTIIGVTPAGFFGETVGERPDFWAPLSMQASLLPGRDWLHDVGPDKVMWLHILGRLKSGVSLGQAEAKANTVFRNGLEAHYGATLSAEARQEFLNQRLVVRPAAGGASRVRERYSNPLYALLGVVGCVLLIACANVANLLLARGAARSREIALRLSLGASRGRLVRQLLTESMVLAMAGGAAGLAVAHVTYTLLVRLVANAEENFDMSFALDWRVMAFSFALTLAAGVLFGLLPALRVTKVEAGAALKAQGRAATATTRQMRWSRALVAVQIALSLPLLVGAALLLRTLHNLQQIDLGYAKENLLLVRVDAQSAGYRLEQRAPLFRELLDEIRRVPGVRGATFSENGVFSGTDSGDQISVEGYTPKGRNDRGAAWDQVGPEYFSTLGVRMLRGREIADSDRAGAQPVCVINEAFAKLFFENRDPIGMHITTEYGDSRKRHQIVGVAGDARTRRLRGEVNPRYYVPVTQPLGEMQGTVFEIRTVGNAGAVTAAVRKAIARRDGDLPVLSVRTVDENIAGAMGQDRILARLSAVFGGLALALACIGLYGVLSYAVARRRGELGVRIALGARPRQVVGMILRETSLLVGIAVAVGLLLSAAAARVLRSQLYGLSPNDLPTYAATCGLLVAVALTAAWLPARRAARVDPTVALRQE